jgi:hypothetical protein
LSAHLPVRNLFGLEAVLRIWDVYPGSDFFSIPDPGSASKNLSILTPIKPKKWFLVSRKCDPGCSSLIPDPDADFLLIPDPGSRGQKGTRSRIRIRNTVWKYKQKQVLESFLPKRQRKNVVTGVTPAANSRSLVIQQFY